MNILIYSKPNCHNCTSAKAILDAKGMDFIERDVTEPAHRDALMRAFPTARQMPQIFIDGQHVGNFAGLVAALKELGL